MDGSFRMPSEGLLDPKIQQNSPSVSGYSLGAAEKDESCSLFSEVESHLTLGEFKPRLDALLLDVAGFQTMDEVIEYQRFKALSLPQSL